MWDTHVIDIVCGVQVVDRVLSADADNVAVTEIDPVAEGSFDANCVDDGTTMESEVAVAAWNPSISARSARGDCMVTCLQKRLSCSDEPCKYESKLMVRTFVVILSVELRSIKFLGTLAVAE